MTDSVPRIITGDTVILVCDQMSGSYMIALDRKTGRERWRRERPGATVSWKYIGDSQQMVTAGYYPEDTEGGTMGRALTIGLAVPVNTATVAVPPKIRLRGQLLSTAAPMSPRPG